MSDPEVAHAAHVLANRPHRHEPWSKMVLVPVWTLQLGLGLAGIVWAICSDSVNAFNVWTTVFYPAFMFIISILVVVEIILLSNHRLVPMAYTILQAIKLLLWTIVTPSVPKMNMYVPGEGTNPSAWTRTFYAVCILAFLASLIYGCLVYYRHRRAMQQMHHSAYLPASFGEHTAHSDKFFASSSPHSGINPNSPKQLHSGEETLKVPMSIAEKNHPAHASIEDKRNPKSPDSAAPPYNLTTDFTGSAAGTQELRGDEKACELSSGRSLKDTVNIREDLVSPEEPDHKRF